MALALPETVRAALIATQTVLRAGHSAVRWVTSAELHLTLQFLGNTDAELVPKLLDILQTTFVHLPAPLLELGSVGVFPNRRAPKIVWRGVAGDLATLRSYQRTLATNLQPLGFQPEARAYTPHLTLGRVKRDPQPEHLVTLGELLNNLPPLPFLAWHASQISLFQSSLTASGPVYTVLGGMQLALPDRSNPTSVVNRS